MRNLFVVISITLLFFVSCQKDNDILSVDDTYNSFDITKGPVNIQQFDSYSNENQVNLYWTTGRPIYYPSIPLSPKVGSVSLYISDTSPDENFVKIHESDQVGEDSTVVTGLSPNMIYYFRIATFTETDSLIGVSRPLMTTLAQELNDYYSLLVSVKESALYSTKLSWSPNGNSIAFVGKDNSGYPNILELDVNSFSIKQLTDYTSTENRLMSIAYSPNGDKIAYCYSPSQTSGETNYRIWVLNTTNLQKEVVTTGRVDADPTWLSNESVIFCRGTHGPPNIPELYLVNLQNGLEEGITQDQNIRKYTPSVLTTDSLIIYSGEILENDKRAIYQTTISVGTNIPLTETEYWRDLQPTWSNDKMKIYFTSDRSGHYEIWAIDLIGKNYTQITHGLKKGVDRFYGAVDPNNKFIAIMERDASWNHVLKILDYMQ